LRRTEGFQLPHLLPFRVVTHGAKQHSSHTSPPVRPIDIDTFNKPTRASASGFHEDRHDSDDLLAALDDPATRLGLVQPTHRQPLGPVVPATCIGTLQKAYQSSGVGWTGLPDTVNPFKPVGIRAMQTRFSPCSFAQEDSHGSTNT